MKQAKKDHSYWERVVESAIGAYLINQSKGTSIEIFYWREDNLAVDFILKKGEQIMAIEVKSTNSIGNPSGLDLFNKKFRPKKILVVRPNKIDLEQFLTTPINYWFN